MTKANPQTHCIATCVRHRTFFGGLALDLTCQRLRAALVVGFIFAGPSYFN